MSGPSLRDDALREGLRFFWEMCPVHGAARHVAETGACHECRTRRAPIPDPVPPRDTWPAGDVCSLHGAYARGGAHALCPLCYNKSRGLRRDLDLSKATPSWWRIQDAVANKMPRFMGDCPAHGFSEYSVTRGCLKCHQGAPILLRPA